MTIKVTQVFIDKYTGKEYSIGDTLELDDEKRVNSLIARKLAEPVEEESTETNHHTEDEKQVEEVEKPVVRTRRKKVTE